MEKKRMYQKNTNGDDMYDSNKYEKDISGNERYGETNNGIQIYLKINGTDIMAKRRNSKGDFVPYFAIDLEGHPICPYSPDMTYIEMDIAYPKNTQNRELYPRRAGNEYYIGIKGNCKYARDENNEQYYATKRFKKMGYYAFKCNKKNEIFEYPRINNNGEVIYIMQDEMIVYPENLTNEHIIFPLDSEGNQTYLEKNGKQFYAFSFWDGSFFAKNKQGDDLLATNQGIPYYGFKMRNNEKHEIYPKLKNNNNFYLVYNGLKKYAKTANKDEYYAQTSQGEDFFADNKGTEYYASTINNIEIYPLNKDKKQFYKNITNIEWIAKNKQTNKGFFAKDANLNEFYPKKNILEMQINRAEKHDIPILTVEDIIAHNATSN